MRKIQQQTQPENDRGEGRTKERKPRAAAQAAATREGATASTPEGEPKATITKLPNSI